jgi:hypothetical protein
MTKVKPPLRQNGLRKPKTKRRHVKKKIQKGSSAVRIKGGARGTLRGTSRRAAQAVAQMRNRGVSLRKAAKQVKVSPRTVLKKAASALRKTKSGRFKAKTGDRLVRQLMIPTPEGPKEISVRGLRTASLLGRYWAAVDRYYETGETSVKEFANESITAVDGTKYPLLTDLDLLNRLGYAGVLSFESLYARSA